MPCNSIQKVGAFIVDPSVDKTAAIGVVNLGRQDAGQHGLTQRQWIEAGSCHSQRCVDVGLQVPVQRQATDDLYDLTQQDEAQIAVDVLAGRCCEQRFVPDRLDDLFP